MNTNYQLIGLALSLLNYAFIFLFIFSVFKVNYYNSIVSFFIKLYKPIGKVSLIRNQSINIIFLSIVIKFISLFLIYSNSYDASVLLGVAVIQNIQIIVRLILFIIIGGVILSWVQPKNSNPFLEIVIEISDKILLPLRGLIPSAGGLDFSPLFIFILIQLVSGFLDDILRYIV
tara:strand:- start:2592 stop:3113 length:522 start_codon:yes stop_codon:yes gene_type:complete